MDNFFPSDLHNERCHREPYAFVNGAMHWVASVKYCCRQNFQLPMNMCSASIYGISITYSDEKPYIGQDGHDSHHFILWVMKEYGVTSLWTQYFTDDGEFGKVIPRPICFRRNGDIVFVSSERQFVSWNCESKEFKDLRMIGYNNTFVDSYVESLVLLDKAANSAVTYYGE